MRELQASLGDLLLDPNNFRFQDQTRFRQVPEARFAEPTVQTNALNRLDDASLRDLKASIQHNGYLRVETVVVRPWKEDPSKFVVIEGNRRVAALLRLKEDHLAGIEVNSAVQETFERVPVLLMDDGTEVDHLAVMGIRHVGGVKKWGPYQSAKLVTEMRDTHELDFSDISMRLGLGVREVTRRYRAFKALAQMEQDEEFGDAADRNMYPIFHEAVSQPVLREWLGWDEAEFAFSNAENRSWLYELLAPTEVDGEEGPARITTSAQVRVMKAIIGSDDALAVLRDPTKNFEEAHAMAAADAMAERWPTEIAEAVRALEKVPALTLGGLDESRLALLRTLRDKAGELLKLSEKLRK